MNLQPKHIPYGVILVLVAWILIADRVHERRIDELQAHSDSLFTRLQNAEVAARSWELATRAATARHDQLLLERDQADAEADSLLEIINSTPHAPRPRRPRTAPELRQSILRAARTR